MELEEGDVNDGGVDPLADEDQPVNLLWLAGINRQEILLLEIIFNFIY